jgi:hypothetical protein
MVHGVVVLSLHVVVLYQLRTYFILHLRKTLDLVRAYAMGRSMLQKPAMAILLHKTIEYAIIKQFSFQPRLSVHMRRHLYHFHPLSH